jgi:hypothetical protein
MKTAMQELIDEIKEAVPYFKMDIYQENFNKALEKEKEQIINAYNQADLEGYFQKTYPKYAEEYYNKTYNE